MLEILPILEVGKYGRNLQAAMVLCTTKVLNRLFSISNKIFLSFCPPNPSSNRQLSLEIANL